MKIKNTLKTMMLLALLVGTIIYAGCIGNQSAIVENTTYPTDVQQPAPEIVPEDVIVEENIDNNITQTTDELTVDTTLFE